MNDKTKPVAGESQLSRIEPGSKEMELFLQAGYPGMTRTKAEQIIKERAQNPALWPYEQLEKAQAFLAALDSDGGKPNDTSPGYKRKR